MGACCGHGRRPRRLTGKPPGKEREGERRVLEIISGLLVGAGMDGAALLSLAVGALLIDPEAQEE